MKFRTITSAAAALAFGAALLVPAAAQAAPLENGGPGLDQGVTRVQNEEGTGVVMNGSADLRWGDGYQRVEHPEGGTWQYGTTNGTYSNFQHGTRKHGCTAKNGHGDFQRITNVQAGKWGYTSVKKSLIDNQAYYHFN
jgi:lactococcin 972 family bacteriocin